LQRPDREQLGALLLCADCDAGLPPLAEDGSVTCAACASAFPGCRGRPVLMRQDNALFPRSSYRDDAPGGIARVGNLGRASRIKALVPGRSVNLARDRMLRRIASEYGDRAHRILVIGCSEQADAVLGYFTGQPVQFVFCDVDKRADADLFCDAHALPFPDGSFYGAITTAVIEHVAWPHGAAAEIHRVLAPGGFVYSELPFLQAVHDGAYDFTRFTLGGHRLLFDRFDEVETGIVAGPGTALVWAITEFAKSLSGNPRVASLLGLAAQAGFFWLKYTDRRLASKPRSSDAASCTFFFGTRRDEPQNPAAIVGRYR
jgi:SAM-dependent methyltransferase